MISIADIINAAGWACHIQVSHHAAAGWTCLTEIVKVRFCTMIVWSDRSDILIEIKIECKDATLVLISSRK